ncbi:MAG: hypothetical protein M1118_10880 [Chloroflexi bacterium]|nr:hypothetical protein [Chloroflexota bacterium]
MGIAALPASDLPSRGRSRTGTVVAYLATLLVIAVCTTVLLRWNAGTSADVLLIVAGLSFIFGLPYTVPIWAALTILCSTALSVLAGDEILANILADLVYYCLAVGCGLGLWESFFERLQVTLPAQRLSLHGARQPWARYVPHAGFSLLVMAAAIITILTSALTAASSIVLVTAALGLALLARPALALATIVVLGLAMLGASISGQTDLAVSFELLAIEAAVTAVLWLVWRALFAYFHWRSLWPALQPRDSTAATPGDTAGSATE